MKKYMILMTALWSFATFSMNDSNNEKGSCLFDTIPDELLAYCLECGIKNCLQSKDVIEAFSLMTDFLAKNELVCKRFYNAINHMINVAALESLIREEQLQQEKQGLSIAKEKKKNECRLLNLNNLPNVLAHLGVTARGKALKSWFLAFAMNSQQYGIMFFDKIDILNRAVKVVVADMDAIVHGDLGDKEPIDRDISIKFMVDQLAALFISGADANALFDHLKHCKILDRWNHFDYLSSLIPILKFYKAKIHFLDRQKNTILILALKNMRCQLAQDLLKLTIDVHVKNNNNMTALMVAARSGCEKSFKKLVELGADLEERDNEDNTILMQAVYGKNLAIVKYLLSLGIDLDAVNKADMTAFDIAFRNRNVTIASLIAAKQTSKKIKQCIAM